MVTIAARYSFIRRQFDSKDQNGRETPIIQYQMQQFKIIPALSASWAHLITSNTLYALYARYTAELRASPRNEKVVSNLLTEIHS